MGVFGFILHSCSRKSRFWAQNDQHVIFKNDGTKVEWVKSRVPFHRDPEKRFEMRLKFFFERTDLKDLSDKTMRSWDWKFKLIETEKQRGLDILVYFAKSICDIWKSYPIEMGEEADLDEKD